MGHRGMTKGNDGMCPLHLCVCMFQGRDILETICVGKEGLTDKIRWETGDPASLYAAFSMLLLWFPVLWNSDNTD